VKSDVTTSASVEKHEGASSKAKCDGQPPLGNSESPQKEMTECKTRGWGVFGPPSKIQVLIIYCTLCRVFCSESIRAGKDATVSE
jgi:Pyruvate/2-oxoacid:ferredoxin oxidoreductase delta subunit